MVGKYDAYSGWPHSSRHKFGHGFHEFFFKVQHRDEEYCDDYFVRLGSQKIWQVKLYNKVANVWAITIK